MALDWQFSWDTWEKSMENLRRTPHQDPEFVVDEIPSKMSLQSKITISKGNNHQLGIVIRDKERKIFRIPRTSNNTYYWILIIKYV